jgi:hypothetical protein
VTDNTFVNSGIASQIIMVPEDDYGVAPDFSAAQPYEFNTETLERKPTIVQGKGMHGGGLHNRGARRVLTNWTVSGGITMDMPTRYLNQLLWQMFGSKGQTAAQLTEDGTTGAYSATHAPGSLKGQSMGIQKGVPSVDGDSANPFTYTGAKLTDWTLNVATGAIATLATTWDGRNELAGSSTRGDTLNSSVPTLGAFTEDATNNVFHFREATLYSGGTVSTAGGITTVTGNAPLGNVKSAEIKYAFHLDTTRFFLGSKGYKAEQIEDDFRDLSGQFVIEWLDNGAMYEAFASQTPLCLELAFEGDTIGSGSDTEGLSLLCPEIWLEGETPKVGGPAVVSQTVPWTGLYDSTNNPIQATYWTLDAA